MAKSQQAGSVAAQVQALVAPVVQGLGLRLWDVVFEKEGANWVLKILIERDTPMDTDTCERASRALDPVLDTADLIEQSYYLEVGSPGLGRKLTKPAHFAAVLGQKVAASLYAPGASGQKELVGALQSYTATAAVLQTISGPVEVTFKAAGAFRLCDDENLLKEE